MLDNKGSDADRIVPLGVFTERGKERVQIALVLQESHGREAAMPSHPLTKTLRRRRKARCTIRSRGHDDAATAKMGEEQLGT